MCVCMCVCVCVFMCVYIQHLNVPMIFPGVIKITAGKAEDFKGSR